MYLNVIVLLCIGSYLKKILKKNLHICELYSQLHIGVMCGI